MGFQQPPDREAGTTAGQPSGWYPDPASESQALRRWYGAQGGPQEQFIPGIGPGPQPPSPDATPSASSAYDVQSDHLTQPISTVRPQPQLPSTYAVARASGGYEGFGPPGAGRHRQREPREGAPDPPGVAPGPSPGSFPQALPQAQLDPGQPPGEPPYGDYAPAPGTPRNAAQPPRRPHRVPRILIGSAAGLVLLLTGTAIGAAGSSASKAAPAPTVTVTAAAAPAATVTVTKTAHAAAAATAAAAPTATAHSAPTTPAVSAASPKPAPASSVLISLSGSGIRNSAPFVVNSSSVTARYSYDCSAFGTSGNFIASIVSGSPSNGTYDDQTIANALGSGGSQTTTVYPQDQGSSYYLEVNSECSWSITLTAG